MGDGTKARECPFGDLSDAATKAALLRDALRRNRGPSVPSPAPAAEGAGSGR